MIWSFGQHELDEETYQLRRRGQRIRIEPKVFDVLLHLVRHGERVVPKTELLDTLWPGEAVSDSVLPRCIAAARRALRDDRSRQKLIQTVHGRGYRFIGRATALEATASSQPARPAPQEPAALEESHGFVGRESALARLGQSLDEARAGRGRVVFLVGEPGIGKTSTVEKLGSEAERAGVRWLAGRCYEGEGAPVFWPWLQVIRALLARTSADDQKSDLGAGAAEIEELVREIGAGPSRKGRAESGEQARFRLFESIAQFLGRAADRQPLLISLDDLHWADPDSLKLLEFVATELRATRVLLLASYRDVDVRREHPLRTLLGALARDPHCERIPLRGLTREEVSAQIGALTGVIPKPALLDAIVAMTEGNPFFVREIATLLSDEGRLDGGSEEVSGGAITLSLPQGVRDAIGRRLDSLSDDCNGLLHVASVIGREFDTNLLERVTEPNAEALLELLGEAEAALVLAETPETPGRYSFTHALLRQTLYEELRASQRVALHRRIGEALASVFGERPDAPVTRLAHHFFEAVASGTAQEAADWSVRAAEHAHARLAYDESARHYERAVEALDYANEPDATRRCELLIAWGDELRTGGARDPGRLRLGEAAELARRLGRADLLAQAAIGYRGFGEMGVPPDAKTLSLLEEARDSLGDAHPALRARLLARLAGTPPYSNSMEERDRLSREGWALACDEGDPLVLVDALSARYWATLGPDRLDERMDVARESRALAQRLGDPRLLLMANEIELGVYLMRGDRARALEATAAYSEIADDLRQPVFRFIASIMLASREMNAGAFDAAEEHIRGALERGRNTVPFADLLYAGQIFWLLHQKGELERVAGELSATADRFRNRFGGMSRLADIFGVSIQATQGDFAKARRSFDALAAQGFQDLERDEHWLIFMSVLAELAFHLGDVERGEQLRALLAPYEDHIVSHDLLRAVSGSVHSVLGLLSTLAGRFDEAVQCYERALVREAALGAPCALHTSEAGLARALEARGEPGDLERAGALWASAEGGFQALGARLPERLRWAAPEAE